MSSTSNDSGALEWQTARTLVDNVDQRLNDLRKFGFGLITGLLSVDALLASIIASWKLAALIGTLLLIVAVELIDRNYRVLQTAASTRAQILERRSRMDLTQAIARIFATAHVKFFFEAVYVIFVLATLLLGWLILGAHPSYHFPALLIYSIATADAVWFCLWPRDDLEEYLIVGSGITILLGLIVAIFATSPLAVLTYVWSAFSQSSVLHYHLTLLIVVTIAIVSILIVETTIDVNQWVDFGIDGYEYERGENVLATVNNVGHKDLQLEPGDLSVHSENDYPALSHPIKIRYLAGQLAEPIKLSQRSRSTGRTTWLDHRWLFSTGNLKPGLYRVVYNGPVYFRTGILKRRFELLDPKDPYDKTKLSHLHYDPWVDAQRFIVTKKERPA
jgi:hypothetical protein